jgi:hypothetical protein
MILAYLLLLTGLTISAVAIYYSVVGLTAIFSAAAIPIMIMGVSLEVAKLVCASWLKQNWTRAPALMKTYMSTAVIILMLITSMGIFGFLSKAHNDQTLVSGDVGSKIAIFDEKIKIQKDNIDSARKALTQMDAAVDQIMARSNDEKGADKAANLRRSQAKERANLQSDIAKAQKEIVVLNDQAAPIRAEVRKVEAEVGPIKYIAAFIYGVDPDAGMLEKAVTWIIILIVTVFDPLAVIMLLGAQMTFMWKRQDAGLEIFAGNPEIKPSADNDISSWFDYAKERAKFWDKQPKYEQDDGPLTNEQVEQIQELAIDELPTGNTIAKDELFPSESTVDNDTVLSELDKWNKMIEEAEREVSKSQETTVEERLATGETFINSDGEETALEADLPEDESKKKTYMIKDATGSMVTKTKE